MYSVYSSSSFSQCGKLNFVTQKAILHAITQSPWVFDRFCGFGSPKVQLKLTEVLNGSAVSGGGIHPGEDDIEG